MDLGTRAGLDPDGAVQAAEHPALVDPSEAARLFERIVANIGRVVQGNEEAIRLSVTCLVAGGHLLVEDVPGVGKTSLGKVSGGVRVLPPPPHPVHLGPAARRM